jgi:nitrous oxidase accessory protein
MHERAAIFLVLVFLSSTIPVAIVPVRAITIIVPDSYPTIGAAIDNAYNGDTIMIRAGTYNETLFIDVSVVLVGDSPDTTVINGPSIYNSTLSNSPDLSTAIQVEANNVKILSVQINNGVGKGIVVNPGSNFAEIADNALNCGTCVSVQSSYVLVDANLISSYDTAILCTGAYCNITNNNILTSPDKGVDLEGANNFVSSNNITDPNGDGYGIFISNSSNTVEGNTIFEKSAGISIFGGSHNVATGNSVGNCTDGLRVDTGFNNTFTKNVVTNCDNGASIDSGAASNSFFFNDFLENVQQVLVQPNSANQWDDGLDGNYWLDYRERYSNATEVGDSGVWNVPYVINADNVDHFPLTMPFETSRPHSTPYPIWLAAAILVATAALVFLWGLAYFRNRKRRLEPQH